MFAVSIDDSVAIRNSPNMKTQAPRRKSASVATSRWAAYATAGVATALGCAATAEDAVASIHYSGPINQFFSGNFASFQLDQPGDSIVPYHQGSAGVGAALFLVNGINAASVAGFSASGPQYASKLGSGVNLNNHIAWVPGAGTLAYRNGYSNSQWQSPGTGFVGFRFDGGNGGLQYGWARITVGGTPGNTFTLGRVNTN